ncbi:hypothetical protein PFISCL1PPCAC_24747 [Pristionchus fissidentatus]|uniref:Uncharacterized protein n=1 Tax=Pristionchus fissidentatus TaxID=1538716 RepID=A0AAV5WSB1_9BILA|nr:hypothetical protein PFISCL1PPCAC_24747 [Pristionchus fissidentatus]
MLDMYDDATGEGSVFGVTFTEGSSSDLFLHVHHIAKAFKEHCKVLFVSSKTCELNLRFFASKLAIRWDQSLLKVLEIGELLGDDLQSSADGICGTITQLSDEFDTILIEDGTVFDALGIDPKEAMKMVERITTSDKKRVLISFSYKCTLYYLLKRQADYDVELKLIGGGFGKDVTGNMAIRRSSLVSLAPERRDVLYLTGERSIKCFPPGHASIFF